MKTEYKYIRFDLVERKAKTTAWRIMNRRSGSCIGAVQWYSAWRQYCFFTRDDCVFNDSCIRDILDFIGQLSAAQKEERSRTGLQHGQHAICQQCNGSGKPGLQLRFGEVCSACGGSGKQHA